MTRPNENILPVHFTFRGGTIMRTIRLQLICVMLFGLLGLATSVAAEEPGFKPIFDGKTLNGWKSPNMS